MAALGSPAVDAQSGSSATINLRRFVISQNVWPGDFNGDGLTDLAGSEDLPSRGGTGRVMVLVGNGAGNFTGTIVTSYVGHVLGVGDFNGDGRADLVVADSGNANPAILPGNGNGTFGAPRPVAATADVTFALNADLDGDGKRDLVVGAEGFTVAVYPGNGDFTFGPEVTLTVNASPHDGIITDLNGDGKRDLVVANHYMHSVTVLMNHGAMQFSGADVALSGNGNDVTATDVNGDGTTDLIVATSNGGDGDNWFGAGHAEVLFGAGDGTFTAGPSYEVPPGAWQIVVGDFTRDGILDIATANRSSITADDWCGTFWKTWDTVSILPGRADRTFGAPSSFSLGNQNDPDDATFKNQVRTLNTTDLNRDGATDLIVSWGIVFLNVEADANWPASVHAGPDQQLNSGAYETVLTARAVDDDQDMLTWTWRDGAGNVLAHWPSLCYRGLNEGANVFTVTVDDGHGHETSDTVTVSVGNPAPTPGAGPKMTLLAPAEGATIPGGEPYSIKLHIDDPSMALYEWSVVYSLDNGATWEYICRNCGQSSQPGIPTSRDESTLWQNPGPASTQAMITVYAQDDADASIGTPSTVHLTIAPQTGNVPYPWQQTDVGAVAKAGSTTYSNGVFTVGASGADIWGTADEFRFTYQAAYDSSIVVTARVDSVQNVHAWTKAGVMIRAGAGAAAPHAGVFVTPGKGIVFQRRLTNGGTSVSTQGPVVTAPIWVKLVTQVSYPTETVRAYYRKNASDAWTFLGQDTFPTVIWQPFAGVALSSHAAGTLATAVFSSVSINPVAGWNAASIGASGGSAFWDDTQVTLKGIGADIWGAADQFEFAYEACYGNCTITARVSSLQNTNQWAKAGVMFRESALADAKHVDIVVTPLKGVAMQYRSATGGVSVTAGSATGAAPGWVRLTRTGNVFTGYWSTDGITFTQVGSITVAMNESTWIGVAATSHNTAATTTAVFDNVAIVQP
jgi:regulation of enolase protein 1 (concanavalin A-like superfamily)